MSLHTPPRAVSVPHRIERRATAWPGTGVVLSGRYRLDRYVATGSAAAVWRAHDQQLGRDVAIKLLLPHHAADDVAVGRFRVEALATARASHPNAVRVFDACSDGSMTYLVMELVEGPSLAECRLPVAPDVTAAVGAQVGAALGAAHSRDLVHRDVKPANVLVDVDGRLKVVDFGIARVRDAATGLTLPHMGMGTARYAAPELLTREAVGPWSDVYGLGLTLWEIVTGRPAFDGESIHEIAFARLEAELPGVADVVDGVPHELAEAISRCVARRPQDRFQHGDEAADAFHAISGARPHELTRGLLDR